VERLVKIREIRVLKKVDLPLTAHRLLLGQGGGKNQMRWEYYCFLYS